MIPRVWWLRAVIAFAAAVSACASPSTAVGGGDQFGSESAPRLLKSTFELVEPSRFAPYYARWKSEAGELVLVPRPDHASTGKFGLFGALPAGPFEGTLWLTEFNGAAWSGTFLSATRFDRVPATLTARAGGALDARIGSAALSFEQAGAASTTMLSTVAVFGHRGASLGQAERDNTLLAIRDSWLFGCSGVELDVTVPHNRDGRPRVDLMRVRHPPEWRAEITGFDSIPESETAGLPDLPSALTAAAAAGNRTVYVDPKLKWLVGKFPDAARSALGEIARHASAAPMDVMIGAETSGPGEAADILAALRGPDLAANWRGALEITRGTDLAAAQSRLERRQPAGPDVVSWNLLRVNGGGGGALRWFVRDVSPAAEAALARAAGAHIVWTATSDRQFDGALAALARMRPGLRDTAVMTSIPHRLAFYLATRARPRQ